MNAGRRPRPSALTAAAVVTTAALVAALAPAQLAVGAPAPERPPRAEGAGGSFRTSFEEGEAQPRWTSTPETGADGAPRASGVVGSSVLERGPSTPTGEEVLGGPTDQLGWEGPFQNGVGPVPGTLEPATTPEAAPGVRWAMTSAGDTWVQVPMTELQGGTTYRAQVVLQGSGEVFLNVYSGSSDVAGEVVDLTGAPQTVVVDFTTPAEGGGTPQFQVRTRESDPLDVLVSGASLQRLAPGALDLPGDATGQVAEISASGENPPAEVAANLADGDISTKWLAPGQSASVTYEMAEPTTVASYALGSANDAPGRDPSSWELQASDDGQSWTTIDTRAGQAFSERLLTRQYAVAQEQQGSYRFYRLEVTANAGDPAVQLAEWLVSTEPVPPSDMQTVVGAGPEDGYAIRPEVGWTGVRALRYSGSQPAAGRGYSYNKVLDVDVPVGAGTELSYMIFPEMSGEPTAYPATYAAVDLAFTDGTYLSELGARDIHAHPLTPQGQGASDVLYPDQWNSVVAPIGDVAAGKTVDRVLVAYDNPAGPADFAGWVDDVAIGAGTEDQPAQDGAARPSDHVLTTRGTNSNGDFSRGNTIPATAVPHGFNFWTPVTDAGDSRWLYRYAEQNNAENLPELQALSLSHEPSPWMGDRQTFQVMPQTGEGEPTADREDRALAFERSDEVARAHYYGVTFTNGLEAEMTPTDHAAMFRFTFPGDSSRLVLDNITDDGGLSLDPEAGVVTGYTDVSAGTGSAGMTRMFVYATVDAPVTGGGSLEGGGGPDVAGYLALDTSEDKEVTMRIATSLVSVEQARHNLELEIAPDDTFDVVRERAQQAWDDVLGVIEVEGATQDQLTTLYSNLYRLNLYPSSAHENTGTAAAPEWVHVDQSSTSSDPSPEGTTATQTGAEVVPGKVYVNNGFWDTYRTTWPAYSLLYPEQAGEMVDGFVQQYSDGGWVSRWSAPGYADIMTGTSSDVAFADAALKGVPGIDLETTYDAALKNATVVPPNENIGRKGIERSTFLGYTPTSTHESASWSLEGYINDVGIANLSKALAEGTDASDPRHQEYVDNHQYFLSRAQDYVNLFNPETGYFQGRDAAGDWRQSAQDFDPRVWGNEFTESSAWNFAFHAPHDGRGLANLMGGPEALAGRLDEFFATPETARFPGSYGGVIHEMREARDVRFGQWGLSNQLSHHIPYMYDYTGQPSKGAAIIREALSRSFVGSEIGQGYPGDEDNGEMSAWQIFASLGFYPLQMGSPSYAIGSPLHTRATVHLPDGDLVVEAPENSPENVYVQGVSVDGVPQSQTSLTHEQITGGATVTFDMGPEPSDWGTGEGDAPPSILEAPQVPTPLEDATGGPSAPAGSAPAGSPPVGGAASGDADADVAALFDDTSETEATLDGEEPWVSYQLAGPTARAEMYTLTSSAADGGDPSAWVLEGSEDGQQWTTLDTRAGEAFTWRQQTRAFSVAEPGIYRWYRVRVTESTGDAVQLAEVEVLADRPDVRELADALAAAREQGDVSTRTAYDLRRLLAAAQRAEDANDPAEVLSRVQAFADEVAAAREQALAPEARAALERVLSQWLAPATGLDQLAAEVDELRRSGDVQRTTARELLEIVDAARAADDENRTDEVLQLLGELRAAVMDAPRGRVSERAREVLLPLVDALLEDPPAERRAAQATEVLMGDYDPEKAWWPSSWWNSAVALQTVTEYMGRTGDTRYLDAVENTFVKNQGTFPAGYLSGDPLLGNFTSRAVDDAAWWGLTWVEAYDLTGEQRYLDMAETIGEYVHGYWDPSTCGGGVWWDAERTYKNAVTNGLHVRLTASLHNRMPGDEVWLERSRAGWDWLLSSGIVNADGLLNDGLTDGCENNGGTVWSYNQGLAVGAGLELWRATGDEEVLATARRLADAGITSPELVSGGVLTESCEAGGSCDDNQKQFKGVFMRYLIDLADSTDDARYDDVVARQATSVWQEARDDRGRLGLRWAGPEDGQAVVVDWRTQASALSALLAVVPPPEAQLQGAQPQG